MALLKKITVTNFKCFREKTSFDLTDGTYFIGANNCGKTTVLTAVHFFFNDSLFSDESFINKTSFLSKKANSNRSEITIEFNLEELTTKVFKQRLIRSYGKSVKISKIISITTDTKIISFVYSINGKIVSGEIPPEISKLLRSVKVTYLHPQEGQGLLLNAQAKLRQRLLSNWGRGSNITQSIRTLQTAWDELRNRSRDYLSKSLTDSLQDVWPESEVVINLPKDIRDIIAVSDINFLGYKNAPDISLASQGTGAQSIVLYLIHFLLDSDRSLHRGEYHPVWLLEEPESFLHVELLSKLARELNSDRWLGNIQMMISTHSPILLAGSRVADDKVTWTTLYRAEIKESKKTTQFTDEEVKEIGRLMGDTNFHLYFLAAQKDPLVFIEDGKALTLEKYISAGVPVLRGLNGVNEISKYLDVYTASQFIVNSEIYFIIDADKGKDHLARFYDENNPIKVKNGCKKFRVKDTKNIYIILLPEGFSAEDLFLEFDGHLGECVAKLWNIKTWELVDLIPRELFRTYGEIRKKKIASKEDAIALIKNTDDVKDMFWAKVEKYGYNIRPEFARALSSLIGPVV